MNDTTVLKDIDLLFSSPLEKDFQNYIFSSLHENIKSQLITANATNDFVALVESTNQQELQILRDKLPNNTNFTAPSTYDASRFTSSKIIYFQNNFNKPNTARNKLSFANIFTNAHTSVCLKIDSSYTPKVNSNDCMSFEKNVPKEIRNALSKHSKENQDVFKYVNNFSFLNMAIAILDGSKQNYQPISSPTIIMDHYDQKTNLCHFTSFGIFMKTVQESLEQESIDNSLKNLCTIMQVPYKVSILVSQILTVGQK